MLDLKQSYRERFSSFRETLREALSRVPEGKLAEVYDRLFSLKNPNVSLTLRRMSSLVTALGNPQESYPVILVTGTNGKGTTTTMIAHILSHLGLRVGLFRKPHLTDYRERYAIVHQGVESYISPQELLAIMDEVVSASDLVEREMGELPSFFEISVGIAYQWFRSRCVDLAVMEIGLGGRLDATNVVSRPMASVVTNIGLEHTKTLGDSLQSIAREKAHIARWARPLITGASGEALEEIRAHAEARGAKLLSLSEDTVRVLRDDLTGVKGILSFPLNDMARKLGLRALKEILPPQVELSMRMLGGFNLANAQLAITAASTVLAMMRRERGKLSLTEELLRRSLGGLIIPGRMNLIHLEEGALLLDSAKDVVALRTLRKWLDELELKPVFLFALSRGKNLDEVGRCLRGVDVIVTQHENSARAMSFEELAEELLRRGVKVLRRAPLREALEHFLENVKRYGFGVVTGSLYLVGDVMRYLNISPLRGEAVQGNDDC